MNPVSTRRLGSSARLNRLGVAHPWVDEATAFCWAQLEGPELPSEAHALSEVLVFLEQMPDDDRIPPPLRRGWSIACPGLLPGEPTRTTPATACPR